jgi:hypothetical protein
MRPYTAIDPPFVPVPAPSVVGVELDGEAVLLEEEAGTLHVLSPTATLVWNLLDGRSDVATIVSDLVAVFEVPQGQMQDDVLLAVREFGRQGLLQGVRPDPDAVAANQLPEVEPRANT